MSTEPPPKFKVLVVDDDPAIVDALSLMLEIEGYEVASMTRGDVPKEIELQQPAAVLLDIRLFGQDGGEICRQLKADDRFAHLPVIIISANRDGRAIARDAGADDFVAKPFDIDDLLAKVAHYTSRSGALGIE